MKNILASTLVLLASCATTQAAKPTEGSDPVSTTGNATAGFDVERDWRTMMVAQVVALRGLPEKTPLQARFHDEASFLGPAQKETGKLQEPAVAARLRAEWLAFGLAKPNQDPVALLSSAYDEQVAAFYAPDERVLHLRRKYPAELEKRLGPTGRGSWSRTRSSTACSTSTSACTTPRASRTRPWRTPR